MIKWLRILFWLIALPAGAQNLIPNPGFEEVFTEPDYQWVQPQGPYYHYELTDSLTQHQARTGNYVNGLCMYNTRENEYLHVKLLNPLEKGKTYRLSFYARLMKAKCFNHSLQKLIGVHFGHERMNTHIPGDLYLKPQLNLELPENDRFDWFPLEGEYTAEGGESFLTLGYFAATQSEEIRRSEEAFLPQKNQETTGEKKQDKDWLYLPPDEQKKFIKEQQKKAKRKKKAKDEGVDAIDFSKPESNLIVYPETGSDPNVRYFQVRYYFDDFCLVELSDSIPRDCTPASTRATLAEGKTITLKNVFFETDEATLREESVVQLRALSKIMNDFPKMIIELQGNTDNRGGEEYNRQLSEARAQAVRDWLVANGIESNRISAVGLGEDNPVATNETEAGRTLNRRVELLIVEM